MKKIIVTVLIVVLLVLALGVAGAVGFLWYRDNHVFVEGDAYPITLETLDLTGEDISIAYYEELQGKLPDCEITWVVPFQGRRMYNMVESISVSALTLEEVELLAAYFPNLKAVDASQSTDYEVLEVLKARLPEVEVIYTVSLGGKSFAPDTAELVLEVGDYDLVTMMENLVYLPQVQTIQLKTPEITLEQVDALRAAYPDIAITCTVDILGQEFDAETTELDLSAMASSDVTDFIEKLAMLPNLTSVELMDESGESGLTKEDVKLLQEAAPEVVFNYTFDFYGVTISTADEEIIVKNTKIGDENEADVRATLDILTNCSRFVLDNCQLSDEVMTQIRDDYRDKTKVVWRVYFGKGSTLTDVEVLRAVYDLVDDNCHDLIYCEDVKYMDIGHNEWLDACDFVAGMTNLEVVIISGAPVKSLEPFRNCKKLKVLEAAFCEYLTDATPLAECESLERVNISYSHITDLTPLDGLPNLIRLTSMYYPKSRVSEDEQTRFMEANPEVQTFWVGDQPYGSAWRYDSEGEYLEWYATARSVFRYDQDPNIPNHVGWYLD